MADSLNPFLSGMQSGIDMANTIDKNSYDYQQRQVDREYMRQKAQQERQRAQAEIDSAQITNRYNNLAADSAEFQLQQLKQEAVRQRKLRFRGANELAFRQGAESGKGEGQVMGGLLTDKTWQQEWEELYPGSGCTNFRPVNKETLNPKWYADELRKVASMHALKRNNGFTEKVSHTEDGKENVEVFIPELIDEDWDYASKNFIVMNYAPTGEIIAGDGREIANRFFPNIFTQLEYEKQQQQFGQQLQAEALQLAKNPAGSGPFNDPFTEYDYQTNKAATDIANQEKAVKLANDMQETQIKQQEANTNAAKAQLDIAKFQDQQANQQLVISEYAQNPTRSLTLGNASLGQAPNSSDLSIPGQEGIDSFLDSSFNFIAQGFNPFNLDANGQPIQFQSSDELTSALDKAIKNTIIIGKQQGMNDDTATKFALTKVEPIITNLLANKDLDTQAASNLAGYIYKINGITPNTQTNKDLTALVTAQHYLSKPSDLTDKDIGLMDTSLRSIATAAADVMGDEAQQKLYKKQVQELADRGLLASVLTSTLGSQLPKQELAMYNLTPSLFDSFVKHEAKIAQVISALRNKAQASTYSNDPVIRAMGLRVNNLANKLQDGKDRMDALKTAQAPAAGLPALTSKIGIGSGRVNNLRIFTISPDGSDTQRISSAIKNYLARGNAVMIHTNDGYSFISPEHPDQRIQLSETEAQQLRQFEIKE